MVELGTTLGQDLQLGDHFSPIQHPWVGTGEIIEVVDSTPFSRIVKVERTARSGSTRIETVGVLNSAHYFKEVHHA